MGEFVKKPIAAGSLFLGKFLVEHVMSNPLKATQFGVPNGKEPVRIIGWYKYKPGEKFTDKDMNVFPDRTDEASIYAVYYRNVDDAGNSYFLDGKDVEDLDKLLENPKVYKIARVASLPATDTWTQWEMFFEVKDAPDDIVAAQGFAIGADWQVHRRIGLSADLNWGLTGIFPGSFKTVEQTLYPIYGTIGVFYRFK